MKPTPPCPLSAAPLDFSLLRGEITALRRELAAVHDELLRLRPTAIAATLTCGQFAERIGRGLEYVQDRCKSREIRTLPGKPYRIPAAELVRWLEQTRRR